MFKFTLSAEFSLLLEKHWKSGICIDTLDLLFDIFSGYIKISLIFLVQQKDKDTGMTSIFHWLQL